MGGKNSKKGFFGKVLSVLSGKPLQEDSSHEEPKSDNLYTTDPSDPIDLQFVKKFTASGGKFLYCEKEEEAYVYLGNIIQESGITKIACDDPNLRSILHKAGLKNLTEEFSDADAFCSSFEYLVSFNGGVMLTAKQTHGRKISELPEVFITIGTTSQITENLRSALTGIRTKYKGDIPSQITTIRGPIKEVEETETSGANYINKQVYLLLIEDQT